MMLCCSILCCSVQYNVIHFLLLSALILFYPNAKRHWDIMENMQWHYVISFTFSSLLIGPCPVPFGQLPIFHIWWVYSECFTSLLSDRQPPFRMSCLMLRFWLWWSAVYVTIWTTEALTMHFKPSKWAQAEVRYQAVVTLVTARAPCWDFCPIGRVLLWLCCTGLQPL